MFYKACDAEVKIISKSTLPFYCYGAQFVHESIFTFLETRIRVRTPTRILLTPYKFLERPQLDTFYRFEESTSGDRNLA